MMTKKVVSLKEVLAEIDAMPPVKAEGHDFIEKTCLETRLELLPSAQPETIPIDYCDCANAMLRMWMDNVVTDGEYYRIMDKLNACWGKKDG